MRSTFASAATAAIAASQVVGAFDLNVNDASSVKSAASSMAKNLWSYYKGDTDAGQVGLLPKPYYWWEAGAMFGTMISYSYLTGDHTYDKDVAAAIYSQASPTDDFMMMTTQAFDLGNDDQAFWALSAMSAAEHGLVAPQGQSSDIWLKLASGAFNDLVGRYNTTTCGGGIKWQFQTTNNGYDYKSSIANGATMQLGARLALLTGNQTYADKASMIFEWMQAVGFVSSEYQVFDGAGDVPDNCTKINRDEWSYNVGALLGASAAMAKYSEAKNPSDVKTWTDRASGLWSHASSNFFKNDVLYEQPCEGVNTCDNDQYSFKAYLARWATFAGQIVPSLQKDITSKLQSTATAIAKSCTGNGGFACGTQWYNGNYNNNAGVGQEMSGLEVVVGLLGPSVPWGTASGSSSSSSSSAAPTTTSAPKSTSSAAPAKTTMSTSTSAPGPSAATLNVVPASGIKPAGSQASNTAANNAASSYEPVMINDQGVPYNTKPVA